MRNGLKKLSPVIFLIVIICFFLPFVNVSCEGTKVAALTGIQLVTGTEIEQPSVFGEPKQTEKADAEPFASAALLSAVLGLGLSFLKGRRSSIVPAILGVAGFVLLLLLKFKIDNEVLKEGEGMVQVEYGIGFWLAFLFLLFAAGWNGFLFSRRKKAG